MQYIISALIAFALSLLLWQIKRKRLALEYEIVESERFPSEEGEGRFFVIKLKNSGNKHIENAEFYISFKSGNIDSVRYSDSRLFKEEVRKSSLFSGKIPLLNPRETLEITTTTKGFKDLSSPKVVVRAKGVTAIPKKEEEISIYKLIAMVVILILISFLVIHFTLKASERRIKKIYSEVNEQFEVTTDYKKSIEDLERNIKKLDEFLKIYQQDIEQGKPRREQLIFGILNRSDLGHLMPSLISTGEGITYWKTGLFLMHSFLVDRENSDKYVYAMKLIIDIENLEPSSKGFNLYLLGKMEQFRGNSVLAASYFDQCKGETPLMYKHLMSQDTAYDLEKIKQWLLKN